MRIITAGQRNIPSTKAPIENWDANLIPSNIKTGISIFGVAGNLASSPYASGTITSSSTNLSFTNSSNSTTAEPYITISGITFAAKFVFAIKQGGTIDFVIYDSYEMIGSGTNPSICLSSQTTFQLTGNAYVNSTGFQIPVLSASSSYTWHAWG